MKKIIPSFLLAVSVSSSLLLAQSECSFQIAQQFKITTDCEQSVNCNNFSPDVSCYLMMDPATTGKGVETLAESLGVFGKRAVAAEITSGERQVLSVTAGGFKTTGENIDAEEDHDSEAEDGTSVNKYLKNEIINNIYAECLAEVANLSLEKRKTAEGSSTLVQQEAAEWAEAKMAADVSKRKAERGVRKAQRETLEARTRVEEAKRNARDAARTPQQAHEANQAVVDATIAYEKARVAYTSSDCETKRLAEIFAEARVETADAVLYAISSHNTTSHTAAETELDAAKEAEMDAFNAAEAAKADVVGKEDCMRIAERKLMASKKSAEEIFGKITGEGVGIKVSSMMKVLESDQRIAEEALAKAKKSDLAAMRFNAMSPHERDLDKESKAYNDAIEAWSETAEGYKIVLELAVKAHIDCSEWTAALRDAEEKKGHWTRKKADVAAKAKEVAKSEALQAEAREKAAKIQSAQAAWTTFINERAVALEKYREVTSAVNNSFSADANTEIARTTYLNAKAARAAKGPATYASIANDPTNCAASTAHDVSAKAALNLFNVAGTYPLVIQRSLMAAHNNAASDAKAGVCLEPYWRSLMSAFEREENAWKSMTASSSWKVCADRWRECSIYWSAVRDAALAWYQAPSGSQQQTNATADSTRYYAALKDSGTQLLAAKASAAAQLTAAQNATQAVDQAFQALKVARDAAYATGRVDIGGEGKFLQVKSNYEAPAIAKRAEERVIPRVEQGAVEVADCKRKADELNAQGDSACTARKTAEGTSWHHAGRSMNNAAEALGKMIEAEVSGKTAKAQTLKEAVAKYKQAASKYQQAAEARARSSFFTGAGNFDSEGKNMMAEADAIVKKAEKQ